MCVIDIFNKEVDRLLVPFRGCSRAIVAGSLLRRSIDVTISFDSLAVRIIQ